MTESLENGSLWNWRLVAPNALDRAHATNVEPDIRWPEIVLFRPIGLPVREAITNS